MTSLIANLILPLLFAGGAPAMQGSATLESHRATVEIAVGGDDYWSRRLRRAVRHQFRAMPNFRVVEEATSPDVLSLIILHHFQPQDGGRLRVAYSLRIARSNRVIGLPGGACGTNDLAQCARQIGLAVHSARIWPNPAE